MTEHKTQTLARKLVRGRKGLSLDGPAAARGIIQEANRLFGPFNWSRDIIEMRNAATRERDGVITTAYVARVKVSIVSESGPIHREAHGCGEGKGTTPFEAHDRGLKAAELDATARAFATMGKALGLIVPPTSKTKPESKASECLSTSQNRPENAAKCLSRGPRNEPSDGRFDPTQFSVANGQRVSVQQKTSRTDRPSKSKNKSDENEDATNPSGVSARAMEAPATRLKPLRRREPDHLRLVRSHPCLVCARQPTDAHHIRFAQPKALGRKVSDEFTVPLCRMCHDKLHRDPDEAEWWAAHKIDALSIARELWEEHQSMGSQV
ncbi:Rad52/Rad22 family DNA repair protein [Hyphobacterium sp. HN65]|uniref:Rad52/Rad22 family DNA repair protein n=1 Tax=Hyphobacterium lacteum TaxID=3116575 RepID=A0ABU7LQI2_9PROT|nr:Rad52/Rad22 family DNA repair protein [Hyphobacterium sp. HN65]MEE2525849.1 Rad52/Rad22 family DNA repair protein [Hyphobacterium sp. HN65]